MGWFALCLLASVFLVAAIVVWRRWIAPWKDVEELAQSIVDRRRPQKFLISANPQSRSVGLALEMLADRQRELEERFREGELSVQAVFGAMLDGLVVVDDRRRVRMMNREFRRAFGLEKADPGEPLLEMILHASIDRLVIEAFRVRQP